MAHQELKEALAEAYATAPAGVVLIHTVEIWHPTFSEPVRLVEGFENRDLTLESTAVRNAGETVTFTACPFRFIAPSLTEDAAPEAAITLFDVSAKFIALFDKVEGTSPIIIIYRPYLSTDTSAPQLDPPHTFSLAAISINASQVTGRLKSFDLGNARFPNRTYITADFPLLAEF